MSGGLPELGSKISLISKADIRYEGRLYTVDPQECTIALSSVRSFGTEDRETQFQIAPQSQIYDYILFRGSDIKDIRVVNNTLPHPNDPAIMQVHLPNGQHLMPPFQMSNMNPPNPIAVGAPGYGNPFGGMGGLAGVGAGIAPGVPNATAFLLNNQQQQQQHQQQQKTQQQQQHQQQQQQQQQQQKQPISVLDMLAGASRSTTPISLISRKSPSAEMVMQSLNQQQHHQQNQQHQNNAGQSGNSRDAGHKRQNHPQRGGMGNQRNGNNNDYYHHPQQQRDRRDSGRNVDNYNNQHHDMRNNYNQRNHLGVQNRAWTMHRGGPNIPNNMMRNRGIGGRGRMPNQGYRPILWSAPAGMQNKPRNAKNAIKFEQDFDFEQANNKFEELRSQLSKLKVGDEPKTEQINGETDKKDDSGNETGAGDHEHEEEEITIGYDKTKSFFDNISCEAAQDRSKNKKNDWRQERKLNSETFGVSSTRRGGSGYRGRGNYYNRNMGNYSGGGGGGGYNHNRNYRTGNNGYRNRRENRVSGGNSRDNSSNPVNASSSNNNNNGGNLKNQTQQPQGSAVNNGTTNSATTNAAKSTTLENNTQPQVASVGAGQ